MFKFDMITEKYHKNTSFWRTQLIQIVLQTGLIIFSLVYRFNASKRGADIEQRSNMIIFPYYLPSSLAKTLRFVVSFGNRKLMSNELTCFFISKIQFAFYYPFSSTH